MIEFDCLIWRTSVVWLSYYNNGCLGVCFDVDGNYSCLIVFLCGFLLRVVKIEGKVYIFYWHLDQEILVRYEAFMWSPVELQWFMNHLCGVVVPKTFFSFSLIP